LIDPVTTIRSVRHPQLFQSFCVVVLLHGKAVDLAKQAGHQPLHPAVASEALLADAAIDHEQWISCLA
jgi:hypothetical protein